jgi:hypothetical protein
MTRSIGRHAGRIAGVLATTAASFAMFAGPAGAADTNPCKVIRRSEIQQAFGGTVSTGRKGVSTSTSSQCEFQVGANGDRPAGTIVVHVRTTGGKDAYAGMKKTDSNAPIDGVPNSLWAEKRDVVNLLKGDVLLGVQGGFLIGEPLPIHAYDDKTQLTGLAQIGLKRV